MNYVRAHLVKCSPVYREATGSEAMKAINNKSYVPDNPPIGEFHPVKCEFRLDVPVGQCDMIFTCYGRPYGSDGAS